MNGSSKIHFVSHLSDEADEIGIKLEVTAGLHTWETKGLFDHQKEVRRILGNLDPIVRGAGSTCECIELLDVYIEFSDGSWKRPDISVFCHKPVPNEDDTAVVTIPDAVIEVINKGYERKDYELNPPFYLKAGVQDVVVSNPHTKEIRHYFRKSAPLKYVAYQSPVDIVLKSGCKLVV